MIRAITRAVPDSFVYAISAMPRSEAIDVPRAREQHAAYRAAEPGVNSRLDGSRESGEAADRVHPEDEAVPDRRRGESRVRSVETLQ